MKITYKRLLLILVALTSVLWQPGHHSFMHHGMAMNSGVHILVTSVPFLAILLALSKTEWDWQLANISTYILALLYYYTFSNAENNIGVTPIAKYKVKRIDCDYLIAN